MSFQPPPTWALPVLTDEKTQKSMFSPIWLKWFVDLTSVISSIGQGGTAISHNGLSGLQGGGSGQYYHMTAAEYTIFAGTSWAAPGTIGSTTPNTGKFTTLEATTTVLGAGFTAYWASPPALGATAPSTGKFTTLEATTTVSGTGFSTYLASPPSIGATLEDAGKFTTLQATTSLTSPTVQATSAAGFKSSDGSTGFTGTITTASLVGKTVTIKDGIITGIA